MTVDLRQLELQHLKAIETIERESYRTPWSRSMFASELAKPSSISLGAFAPEGGELIGYLIISRYVDAWHVMNIAVDPDERGRGVASMLLERLFELTADDPRRGYTLEVRVSNATAIRLYERLGFERAPEHDWSPRPGLQLRVYALDLAASEREQTIPPENPVANLDPR